MSRITINSNTYSLNAQRRLGESSASLLTSFGRLSSGLRVNRAKDDAAGLAIASSLNVDKRVFAQGIRNLNDGASLLNIADGSLQEMGNIVIRLRELAEQSANGTLGTPQRKALDAEAQALAKEYHRIAQSTQFNNRSIFDGQLGDLRVQNGYGAQGAIVSSIGGAVGSGTFASGVSYATGGTSSTIADVNADGFLDIVHNAAGGQGVSLGNGNGTFRAPLVSAGGVLADITVSDFNNDGFIDIVGIVSGATAMSVSLGNGDGTFRAQRTYALLPSTGFPLPEDFNSDGKMDLVVRVNSNPMILLGNGDGSFALGATPASTAPPSTFAAGDVNGDGVLDLVATESPNDLLNIFIGNGDGTFHARLTVAAGSDPYSALINDYNGDGIADIAAADSGGGSTSIYLGVGDGTFRPRVSFTTSIPAISIAAGDFNGDGIVDLVGGDIVGSTISVMLGNGNGSFKATTSYALAGSVSDVVAADFNDDGVYDIYAGPSGQGTIFLGGTLSGAGPLLKFSLRYAHEAKQAMSLFESAQRRINVQRSTIGAFQSRIDTGTSNLRQTIENVATAEAQIMDVDVAEETANLTKNRILQQAGAAILAQANQIPNLALTLLGNAR